MKNIFKKENFKRENIKIKKSLIFVSVIVLVCCVGVVNNRIQSAGSLGVSAGYDDYEAAEMESHNGEVLVDSLNITQMPGRSDTSSGKEDEEGAEGSEGTDSESSKTDTEASESGKADGAKTDKAGEGTNSSSAGTALVASDEATGVENTDEYFREARETITYDRNEMISMLTDTIETSADGSQKNSASQQKDKLLEYMEKEKNIESLIRNKGFTDAFVLITDRSVNVTVQTDTLSENDAAKILDIVIRETGRSVDDVVIQAKAS